jgi:hypothetical protein
MHGFRIDQHPHPVNALPAGSELRVQFTTDDRYQSFIGRSRRAEVLGVRVSVASLQDVTQGKLWAYGDSRRRLSERKKDELDLIRLAAYPEVTSMYPAELRELIERGWSTQCAHSPHARLAMYALSSCRSRNRGARFRAAEEAVRR